MSFSQKILDLSDRADAALRDTYARIDRKAQINQNRVMEAFRRHRVSDAYFGGTTGYGYGDAGRDAFDAIVAEAFGCEAAVARIQFVSGTHALTVALFGVLRPGDEMIYVTGGPYDTLAGLQHPPAAFGKRAGRALFLYQGKEPFHLADGRQLLRRICGHP